jgi:dUTP pyrophosphatase
MKLQYKRLTPKAKPPLRAHLEDAGFDLTATAVRCDNVGVFTYKTGIAVAIPFGHVGILKERSSIRERGLSLVGGVIDCGYTGEIEVSFLCPVGANGYEVGDRICQLVVVPLAEIDEMEEVKEFDASGDRGEAGFGSTGK